MTPIRLAICMLALTALCSFAQSDGITVLGSGSHAVKPDLAEATFDVSASAEIAGDAITRFEQTRARVADALNNLNVPNAQLVEQAFSIGLESDATNTRRMQIRMMQGGEQKMPSHIVLTQPLTIRLTGIDKLPREAVVEHLSRIIDTARDLGLNLSESRGGGAVQFLVSDMEAAQAKALDAAFADAKKQAEALAKRAGVTLGGIASVLTIPELEDKSNANAQQTIYNPWMGMAVNTAAATNRSGAFAERNVTASVRIRYTLK